MVIAICDKDEMVGAYSGGKSLPKRFTPAAHKRFWNIAYTVDQYDYYRLINILSFVFVFYQQNTKPWKCAMCPCRVYCVIVKFYCVNTEYSSKVVNTCTCTYTLTERLLKVTSSLYGSIVL